MELEWKILILIVIVVIITLVLNLLCSEGILDCHPIINNGYNSTLLFVIKT